MEVNAFFGGNGTAPSGHAVPEWLGHYASLEQGAAEIRTFEPVVVPGLLQTRRYATAVALASHRPDRDSTVSQRVESRMARQRVLDRAVSPLKLCAIIDESVLRRVTGDHQTMTAQLDHLAAMAERPTVDLRVLPFGGSIHCAAWGAFHLLRAPGAAAPFMACAEDVTGFRHHEAPYAVKAHAALFDHLSGVALSPHETLALITAVTKELDA